MAKINVILGINQEQPILGLNPGKYYWNNETLGQVSAKGVVLPTGTVVEVIQE